MIVPVTITISAPPLPASLMQGMHAESVPSLFPNTLKRLGELAREGQRIWMERAMKIPGLEGRPLRLGTGPSDRMVFLNPSQYAQSIAVQPMETESGGLSVVIGTADRQALPIEIGGPDIDLHAILDYAPKARISKKGNKYLRIPFRHATTSPEGPSGGRFQSSSNVLPPQIYAIAKALKRSTTIGFRREASVNQPGTMVRRRVYSPGAGRLSKNDIVSAGLNPDSGQGRNLIGLQRVGKKGHGHYLTVRTLSQANPNGWRIGGYPAQHLANDTAAELQRIAQNWFEDALKDDAAGWLAEVA